jgi:hypothetical protein
MTFLTTFFHGLMHVLLRKTLFRILMTRETDGIRG